MKSMMYLFVGLCFMVVSVYCFYILDNVPFSAFLMALGSICFSVSNMIDNQEISERIKKIEKFGRF